MSSLVLATCICAMGDSVEFRLEIYRMVYMKQFAVNKSRDLTWQHERAMLRSIEHDLEWYSEVLDRDKVNLAIYIEGYLRYIQYYRSSSDWCGWLYSCNRLIASQLKNITRWQTKIDAYELKLEIYYYKHLSQTGNSYKR